MNTLPSLFNEFTSEIKLPTGYQDGYSQTCTIGISEDILYETEKLQITNLNLEDKLFVLLKKDYFNLLSELIFCGNIELGEQATTFYENFKYDNVFTENKATMRLELLILNYDLQQMLNEKTKEKQNKI